MPEPLSLHLMCPYHKDLMFRDFEQLTEHMKTHWQGVDLHSKPDGDKEVI